MGKKLLSILLVLCMVVAISPSTALVTAQAINIGVSDVTSLQNAFNTAGNGDIIVLDNDIDLGNSSIIIAPGISGSFKLDLNSHAITGSAPGAVLRHEGSGRLTIRDSYGLGSIKSTHPSGWAISNKSEITIWSGTFSAAADATTAVITNEGSLSIVGGTVRGGKQNPAISCTSATSELSVITDCFITSGCARGTIIADRGAKLQILGGTVYNEDGRAIDYTGADLYMVHGGAILGNVLPTDGLAGNGWRVFGSGQIAIPGDTKIVVPSGNTLTVDENVELFVGGGAELIIARGATLNVLGIIENYGTIDATEGMLTPGSIAKIQSTDGNVGVLKLPPTDSRDSRDSNDTTPVLPKNPKTGGPPDEL